MGVAPRHPHDAVRALNPAPTEPLRFKPSGGVRRHAVPHPLDATQLALLWNGASYCAPMTDQPATPEPLHSPEHQRAVGRIVIAGSGIEGAVANVAARLLGNDDQALRRLGRMSPKQVRDECGKLVTRQLAGRVRDEVLAWLDRADSEADKRHRIVHATWLRVDKPEPGAVAFVHYGPRAAAAGYALIEQVPIADLDGMGMVMESVAFFGLVMVANVEAYLDGSYVEPPGPPPRP